MGSHESTEGVDGDSWLGRTFYKMQNFLFGRSRMGTTTDRRVMDGMAMDGDVHGLGGHGWNGHGLGRLRVSFYSFYGFE